MLCRIALKVARLAFNVIMICRAQDLSPRPCTLIQVG